MIHDTNHDIKWEKNGILDFKNIISILNDSIRDINGELLKMTDYKLIIDYVNNYLYSNKLSHNLYINENGEVFHNSDSDYDYYSDTEIINEITNYALEFPI